MKNTLEASFSSKKNRQVIQIYENIGAHLANKLTEEYEKFQVFQKMFSAILYERIKKPKNIETKGLDESVDFDVEEERVQCIVVMDEAQESMLEERSQEIDSILNDTLHLNDLLRHIQFMTVQQGSLLDRIDVNLDKTRGNLKKTIGSLERTADSFSLHQKRLFLFFITLAIFLVTFLIISK